ncbi:MAG: HD domain-containing phosphohydrolase [bacterium]
MPEQQRLVIDDVSLNLKLMEHLIRRMPDCASVLFESSADALDWCATHDPDLVIVDYMMPAPDGLEFAARFRQIPGKSDTPILMVTANTELEVRYRALEAGINDFLNKPIDRTELLARARNMLRLRDAQKQLEGRAAWLETEVRAATAEIAARELETIVRLARAAEFRDPETGAHIQRMAHCSRLIARQIGLSEQQQEILLLAAPLHDVGKLGTPDRILLKRGRLEPDEWEVMKEHATIGYEILRESASPVIQAGAEIAWSHHEKFDGTGYPRGLTGDSIPLFGRIVAIADVFDALTSARPYKRPWSVEEALSFMREQAGRHFDPRLLDAFFVVLPDVIAMGARFSDDDEPLHYDADPGRADDRLPPGLAGTG